MNYVVQVSEIEGELGIVLPVELVEKLGLSDGDSLEVEPNSDGYILTVKPK